jgi:hypothetical protein
MRCLILGTIKTLAITVDPSVRFKMEFEARGLTLLGKLGSWR